MGCNSVIGKNTLAYYDKGLVDTVRSGCLLTIFSLHAQTLYEETVVVSFKSNLLLMSFCLHIINYNS